MDERIEKLEREVELIRNRNKRVEGDKAWETSHFRVLLISVITYIIAVKFLYLIGAKNYALSALMPTIGYFLSAQSLPFIKKWWMKRHGK
jgi:hypothetical protein